MSQFNFNYQIVEILPLSELNSEQFKNHRRLRVFATKGCTCVNCGIKGDTLALGIDNKGNKHWDVYNTIDLLGKPSTNIDLCIMPLSQNRALAEYSFA